MLPTGTRSIVSYLQALSNRIQGKKFIGADEHGNKFWEIANPGGVPDPKREVEFVSKDMVGCYCSPPRALTLDVATRLTSA